MAFTPVAQAQTRGSRTTVNTSAGIQRLKSATNGAALVSVNRATGAARFVRMSSGKAGEASFATTGTTAAAKSADFFRNYGSAFGIANAATELRQGGQTSDVQGGQHLTYKQVYNGVLVFAGELKTHFDADGNLYAVNGNFIPEISVNPTPSRAANEAAAVAINRVKNTLTVDSEAGARSTEGLVAKESTLYIYRTNLARGIPGENHLVWQVEVTNGGDVREFVYVDAHLGKVVDQITGIQDAMVRRAYDGQGLNQNPPPNWIANNPFWVEGQAFPTGNVEADNMIISSKETYDFYKNAFGRDSFDGVGGTMHSIFNRGYSCPNASWNGTFISFCAGFTTDDVTGHEWTHAYTQYTHGLIYAHQPGALNESYSDIFGETIDLINNRMTDTPGGLRQSDAADCSEFTQFAPVVRVNSPAIAGSPFTAGRSLFGPNITAAGVTGDLVLANDGSTVNVNTGDPTTGTINDGCQPYVNAASVAGKVAFVERGACGFKLKTKFAQDAGATAIVIFNTLASQTVVNLADDPTIVTPITIPTTLIAKTAGDSIRPLLATPVNVSVKRNAPASTDPSLRWMVGEDDSHPQLPGALRDMWKPTCAGNPGKVSDAEYTCAADATAANDQGGVHGNSGVPNHAYALIVDGGVYNGQTITGIGLTKAAHIYFRAMTVYQHSASDFIDHADAIEQAATDLKNAGTNLNKLTDGTPSGEVVTAADITQIQKAMLAVEMRSTHTGCNFPPLLAQNPPADSCGVGMTQNVIFSDNFEGSTSGWTVTLIENVPGALHAPNWTVSSTLPDRTGKAFFASNPDIGACNASSNEAGVKQLTSPAISIPANVSAATLTFDHWVATEGGFDGGQLMVSVNGAPFTLVPDTAFIYNAYNATLLAIANPTTDNPRGGQKAFTGTDGGKVDGSWGRSVVNLAGIAPAGSSIKLRWDLSSDCGTGRFGWYVDNVKVSSCEAALPAYQAAFDFDGDNKADLATFRGSDGFWNALSSNGGSPRSIFWGNEALGDKMVPGDYDGDGKTDFAVYRSSTGEWYISKNAGGDFVVSWGNSSDKPVPADFDGDGKTDIAVFRPGSGSEQGVWYVLKSSDNFNHATHIRRQWGLSTDTPIPADFNKDGKADFAVVRANAPSSGLLTWYIGYNGLATTAAAQWGLTSDKIVPGDYDGDRQTDIAVWRPSNGNWYIINSTGGSVGPNWGLAGDVPVPADFDGDGKTDLAVFRPSNNTWYILGTTAGVIQQAFGSNTEAPVQAFNQ
ncbi:MAG: M4 family metallopeptidase [Pyrinomonadaceae bacterium]